MSLGRLRPRPTRRWTAAVRSTLVVTVVIAATACGSESTGSDAERFCGELGADPASVVAPPLDDVEGLDSTLERYRDLADLAPVAVEEAFRSVLLSLETASTVVPDDPSSVQRAVAQAYASERSAVEVRDWVLTNCGVDLGPVATITPHGPSVTPPAVTDPDAPLTSAPEAD